MFSLYIIYSFLCVFSFLFVEAFGDSVWHSFWFWFINIFKSDFIGFLPALSLFSFFFCFFALSRMLFFIIFLYSFFDLSIFLEIFYYFCVFLFSVVLSVFSLFFVFILYDTDKKVSNYLLFFRKSLYLDCQWKCLDSFRGILTYIILIQARNQQATLKAFTGDLKAKM